MHHSPGKMGSHISSKAASIGDTAMENQTPTIQSSLVKVSMEFLMILMLHLYGLGMGRSISSKELNIGGLIRISDHL